MIEECTCTHAYKETGGRKQEARESRCKKMIANFPGTAYEDQYSTFQYRIMQGNSNNKNIMHVECSKQTSIGRTNESAKTKSNLSRAHAQDSSVTQKKEKRNGSAIFVKILFHQVIYLLLISISTSLTYP